MTLFSFLAFVGLWVWAWSRRNRARFDEAAQLPFVGEGVAPVAEPPLNEDRSAP
ncbi:MAG: CcoQ/FixQ family Cbb3-type cytochrome c oxidase assembly chaperone [Rubrivivax sp.]